MKVLEFEEKNNKIYLDKKDVEILSIISKNCRLNLSNIAKITNLSREIVDYRIRRFYENKILTGSRTVINIKKLNYFSVHIFLELNDLEHEEEFIEKLKKNKNINAIVKYSGKWDFEIAIMLKNIFELNKKFNEILICTKIRDYKILIITETIRAKVLPENEFPEKKVVVKKQNNSFYNSLEDGKIKKQKTYEIDRTDFEILKILSNNANTKITEASKILKISEDKITYRIKKMIESKHILEFRPIINYDALGLSIQTVLLRTNGVSELEEKKIDQYLSANKNVLWCAKTIGEWNYIIYTISKNQSEFHAFFSELRKNFIKNINHYDVLFAYQEFKYSFVADAVFD